ncbi:nucleotidyltransferase domain-containing protein [Subtercola boreus]|uniref:nucleotidyltransferase domain-containing protein n=1 Tax=Subtercola boreus TaxID=120213 RepID=UPI0014778327|nr:nucleotidyltransferase domain-containing protein [Subtercola boreus]
MVEEIVVALPTRAVGVILYGSYARGDYTASSDIDLLAVSQHPGSTIASGRANLSTYDLEQFATAIHTLFGAHLARDAVVLHDSDGVVIDQLATFGGIDLERLWSRVRNLAKLLTLPIDEQHFRLDGFVRHARYVLRTATYARAFETGSPCFSVAELAGRFKDPDLIKLLSSHSDVQGPPTPELLYELRVRIETLSGEIESLAAETLTDVIVEFDDTDLGDAAILILGNHDGSPYTIIPRVIL